MEEGETTAAAQSLIARAMEAGLDLRGHVRPDSTRNGRSAHAAALSRRPQDPTASQPTPSQLRRLNAEGDSVPGSQDTVLAGIASGLNLNEDQSARRNGPILVDEQGGQNLIANGICQCPWCSFSSPHINGLMVHASRAHAGKEGYFSWNCKRAARACQLAGLADERRR